MMIINIVLKINLVSRETMSRKVNINTAGTFTIPFSLDMHANTETFTSLECKHLGKPLRLYTTTSKFYRWVSE